MFIQRVKHYHQWLRTAIPFKTRSGQNPSDSVRIQSPSKDQALATCIQSLLSKNAIERVENVKSLGFYSRLFLVPKPHQRSRPVIDLSRLNTFLHIEKFKMETPESIRTSLIPGEWVSSIDVSDTYLHIPIHPDSRKYLGETRRQELRNSPFWNSSLFKSQPVKEGEDFLLKKAPLGKVLPQVTGVPVHLPPFQTSHRRPGLYYDCKGSEANGPLEGTQTSPIPGRLADQVPVSGGSPREHSGSGRPNPVLGVDNKSGKIQTKANSGVFVRGLRIPSRFSPCKTHSREMAQTSGFDPMFDVANLVACLNGENGPRGTPSHEALSVSSQEALEISSVAGQPSSLHRNHSAHLDWWQNPSNVMRGADLLPKDHSIQLFTDASNEGWGAHLEETSTKGLWSDREKRLHINVLELKAVSLALRSFKDQYQNQTMLVATDNSTVVAYINKQGGTHSAEMCALLWKIMTQCHHYQIP